MTDAIVAEVERGVRETIELHMEGVAQRRPTDSGAVERDWGCGHSGVNDSDAASHISRVTSELRFAGVVHHAIEV